MSKVQVDYDLIIIGCGPGGMNACLYATRSKLKTLVIERNCPGGKVIKANTVENWLGTEKISGVDLSLQMFKHSFAYGGVYEQGNVLDVVDYKDYKEVVLKDKTYKCYSVIIAIGTSESKSGFIGEEKFYGKGVSYCAVCDAALYKNKTMVVIGDSDHALEETLYLSNFASKIYLLNKKDSFGAKQSLISDVTSNEKVEIIYNSVVKKVSGSEYVESITIDVNGEEKVIETNVVFPLLGDVPDTKFVNKLGITNEKGYVIVDENKKTKVEGIYAIGDCTTTALKQIITASSDGALAAIDAHKYVKNMK